MRLILSLLVLFFNSYASTQVVAAGTNYRSEVDELLTIHHITLLPVTDNVGGIYSGPIEKRLKEILESNHKWGYVANNVIGNIPSDRELESDTENTKRLGLSMGVDAFLTCKLSKGPKGMSLSMSLFSAKDGKLLVQESNKEFSRFEINSVLEQASTLLARVFSKIPYEGQILSRNDLKVTINLGKKDGIKQDTVLSVIQIIKLNRHPKFNFLVNTEKEIIGKVKIYKVDDTISFGGIISEKEKGVVQKNAKISGLTAVNYSATEALGSAASDQELIEDRPDSFIAFGSNPDSWIPRKPPTLGQVGFNLGIGNFSGKIKPSTGEQELSTNLFAGIGLTGELWLNQEWTTRAQIRQSVFSSDNPAAGSSPGKLSVSLQTYAFVFGYNFLLEEDFFSSKIELSGGFANYSFLVDDTNPRGFTSANYFGPLVGIRGTFPITKDRVWWGGAELAIFFNPSLKERPISSGSGDHNTINEYNFFVSKMVTSHLYIDGTVNVSLYRTQFDGASSDRASDPVTDMSFKNTFYNLGFRYLF